MPFVVAKVMVVPTGMALPFTSTILMLYVVAGPLGIVEVGLLQDGSEMDVAATPSGSKRASGRNGLDEDIVMTIDLRTWMDLVVLHVPTELGGVVHSTPLNLPSAVS